MVEPSCGDICDDTALNSVRIFCSDVSGQEVASVTSKKGNFGGWNNPLLCGDSGSFITGVQFKSEKASLCVTAESEVIMMPVCVRRRPS